MKDEAVPFFGKAQKILGMLAKIEKKSVEDWLGTLN
jgi:hypothetical protein